jgi:hypothetical protein
VIAPFRAGSQARLGPACPPARLPATAGLCSAAAGPALLRRADPHSGYGVLPALFDGDVLAEAISAYPQARTPCLSRRRRPNV